MKYVRRMTAPVPIRASWTVFQRALVYVAGAVLVLLAVRWLYLFVLTDYRSHQRSIIIPLALVVLVLGFALFRLSSVAVFLSLLLASVAGAAALYLQVSAAFIQPFLSTVVLASLIYLCALAPPLINRLIKR